MPIVDVTHGPRVTHDQLRELARMLPHEVSLAVECPEEPYDGELRPGDVEIRFRDRGRFDPDGLEVLIEVKSKWFASRADDRQARCERIRDAVAHQLPTASVGVYLTLAVAAWAQSE